MYIYYVRGITYSTYQICLHLMRPIQVPDILVFFFWFYYSRPMLSSHAHEWQAETRWRWLHQSVGARRTVQPIPIEMSYLTNTEVCPSTEWHFFRVVKNSGIRWLYIPNEFNPSFTHCEWRHLGGLKHAEQETHETTEYLLSLIPLSHTMSGGP